MLKVIVAFLLAVLAADIFGVVTYSQLNLAALIELGMPVDIGVRIETTLHDLISMSQAYVILLIVALGIAFSVAALILKRAPQIRYLGFISAGFVALLVLNLGAIEATGGMHPLPVTRTTIGLLSQCLAGAVGGWVFAMVRSRQLELDH